jgi:uncharacterized protein YjbI with pentapeptide repeats
MVNKIELRFDKFVMQLSADKQFSPYLLDLIIDKQIPIEPILYSPISILKSICYPFFNNGFYSCYGFASKDAFQNDFIGSWKGTIRGCSFFRASLEQTDFAGIKLKDSTFAISNFAMVDFGHAELENVLFEEILVDDPDCVKEWQKLLLDVYINNVEPDYDAYCNPTNFNEAKFNLVSFIDCKLEGIEMYMASIEQTFFLKNHISDSSFEFAKLKNSHFNESIITNTNFRNSSFENIDFSGRNAENKNEPGQKSYLEPIDDEILKLYKTLHLPKACKLDNVSFQSASLKETYFIYCELQKVNFSYTSIFHTEYYNAKLNQVDFSYSTIERVFFKNALLQNINFSRARLNMVDFRGASFENANFNGSTLNRINFMDANLEGADFSYADLKNVVSTGDNTYLFNQLIQSKSLCGSVVSNELYDIFVKNNCREMLEIMPENWTDEFKKHRKKIIAKIKHVRQDLTTHNAIN